MPAFYAHKFFGERVLDTLPSPLKENLNTHKEAFVLGTQGPDILFYHKPFSKNDIKTKGMDMHLASAMSFFKDCAEKIAKTPEGERSAKAAYVAGFICHFMLDNACHPHVYALEDTGVQHGLIESEFDKYLKRQNGEKTHKNAAKGLTKKHGVAPATAEILEVDEKAIKRAIKTMRTVNGLFSSPSRAFHKLAKFVLGKLGAASFESMFLHFSDDPACAKLSPVLAEKLENAVQPTAELIEKYFQSVKNVEEDETFTVFDNDYKGESLL